MQRYPYVNLADDLPPAPILPVTIATPDWAISKTYETEAFLDTGSDSTLIPLEILSVLQLQIVQTAVEISGVGGGQVNGFACYTPHGWEAYFSQRKKHYWKAFSSVFEKSNSEQR